MIPNSIRTIPTSDSLKKDPDEATALQIDPITTVENSIYLLYLRILGRLSK